MGKIDISPSTIITLGIIAGIGYIGYKFMKGEWKIPSVVDVITEPFKTVVEAVGNIPVETPLPGGETLDAGTIVQLWEAGTGQAGTVYGVKNGEPAIGYIPSEGIPMPIDEEAYPGQLVESPTWTTAGRIDTLKDIGVEVAPIVEGYLSAPTAEEKIDILQKAVQVIKKKKTTYDTPESSAKAQIERAIDLQKTPLQLAAERRKQILGQV